MQNEEVKRVPGGPMAGAVFLCKVLHVNLIMFVLLCFIAMPTLLCVFACEYLCVLACEYLCVPLWMLCLCVFICVPSTFMGVYYVCMYYASLCVVCHPV